MLFCLRDSNVGHLCFTILKTKCSKMTFLPWCHRRTIWSALFAPLCSIVQSMYQNVDLEGLRGPSFHVPFSRCHYYLKCKAKDCNCTRPSCTPTIWHFQGLLPFMPFLYLSSWDGGVKVLKKKAKYIISIIISLLMHNFYWETKHSYRVISAGLGTCCTEARGE